MLRKLVAEMRQYVLKRASGSLSDLLEDIEVPYDRRKRKLDDLNIFREYCWIRTFLKNY